MQRNVFTLTRYSLKYSPSTLEIYFVDSSISQMKCRSIELHDIPVPNDSVLVDEIIKNNADLFVSGSFSRTQLLKLVSMLQKNASTRL